jgi:5,5'-dehydrodivanillate O-demethylase
MLTREENETLTRVGGGTPAGELLRRYWMPVACAGELTDDKPIKAARLLGEDLVVYRDRSGRYGVVGEQCPHRKASLAFGRVDEEGIRCPYHGWKFDNTGACLEQPAEPEEGEFKNKIKHTAYPVEKLGGLLWTYLGPEPRPLLPRWDVLAWENGRRWIEKHEIYHCNWLQPMENAVDPSHTRYLHGESFRRKGIRRDVSYILKKVDHFEYDANPWGIMKRRVFEDGDKEIGHLLLMPNMLRHPGSLHFRVPIDDTHTQIYRIIRLLDGKKTAGDLEAEFVNYKNDEDEFHMETFPSQDAMAWETQGAITDRTQETLGDSDRGITIFRKLLREQIELVARGGEPMALVRDPAQNRVINFVTTEWKGTED